ncbi:MAG: rRNA maturation RNase YbeY [Candidatus Yanofskybacteria bacterium]|nr:rRNA maturation RNase YbeY [Candidatus Yanofskybacteria bacterium]
MIEINNQTNESVDTVFIKRVIQKVLKLEGKQKVSVSVALVASSQARDLNRKYRKQEYVPDVLSFEDGDMGLGELVLCPEKIRADSEKYGITEKEELGRCVVHGVLHLLSYTHKTMQEKEEEYFGLLFK